MVSHLGFRDASINQVVLVQIIMLTLAHFNKPWFRVMSELSQDLPPSHSISVVQMESIMYYTGP